MVLFVTERGCALGPFFCKASGETATKPWFVGEVWEILAKCGLNQSDFDGHSFRIGAATTAALAGIEDSAIQVLGRWHSTAILRYIRTPKERLATLSASLSKQSHTSFIPLMTLPFPQPLDQSLRTLPYLCYPTTPLPRLAITPYHAVSTVY